MTTLTTVLAWLYIGIATWLALYGAHALLLTLLSRRGRRRQASVAPPTTWPRVTVQIPLYNERAVAARILDAVARFDYPREQLEIQVLDDSTDETSLIVAQRVTFWRARGVNMMHVRRPHREHFKAGALQFGLQMAHGECIAIFDADFVPPPDWLRRAVALLMQDERIGLVQTRWGHLNDTASLLTRAQAVALDGHFLVEQVARHAHGLFLNFNGTAGVWRRVCIEDAGGWRATTLSEDLDLSYRAQLCGWRLLYSPEIIAHAEIPMQMAAFKRQQFRWAKGSIQAARLLLPAVWRAPVPWRVKLAATLHLTGYSVHPAMLVLLLLSLPLMAAGWPVPAGMPPIWLSVLGMSAPLLYAVAQYDGYPRTWRRRLTWLPLLMALGLGMALNNARAVWEGVWREGGVFERTPKTGAADARGLTPFAYTIAPDMWTLVEALLGWYAFVTTGFAWVQGRWGALPFLMLYTIGFWWVSGQTMWQHWRLKRHWRRLGVVRRHVFGYDRAQHD